MKTLTISLFCILSTVFLCAQTVIEHPDYDTKNSSFPEIIKIEHHPHKSILYFKITAGTGGWVRINQDMFIQDSEKGSQEIMTTKMIGGEFGKQIDFPLTGTGDTILGFEYPPIPKEWKKMDWKSHSEGSWAIYGIALDGAKNHDIRIQELLNNKDWLALDSEYNKYKSRIKNNSLKDFSEVMLNLCFNHPKRAMDVMDAIMAHSQTEIGLNSLLELTKIYLHTNFNNGNYNRAYEVSNSMLKSAIENQLPQEIIQNLTIAETLYSKFKDLKPLEIIRPNKNIEVPMGIATITFNEKDDSNGIEHVTEKNIPVIKVTINGKESVFLFDTGFESTTVFENVAEELKLQTIVDSIAVVGIGSQAGTLALLDSLSLGELIFKNILVATTKNFFVEGGIDLAAMGIAGILGLDLMRKINEIQTIKKPDGKYGMFIPFNQSALPESGKNIYIDDNKLYISTKLDSKSSVFHFDTGNSSTHLTKEYYEKHKTWMDENLEKQCACHFGVGEADVKNLYILPELNVNVAGVNFHKKDVNVYTEDVFLTPERSEGSLGADFLLNYNKVILNFDQMFVKAGE